MERLILVLVLFLQWEDDSISCSAVSCLTFLLYPLFHLHNTIVLGWGQSSLVWNIFPNWVLVKVIGGKVLKTNSDFSNLWVCTLDSCTGWPNSKFEMSFGYNPETMHFWPHVGKDKMHLRGVHFFGKVVNKQLKKKLYASQTHFGFTNCLRVRNA